MVEAETVQYARGRIEQYAEERIAALTRDIAANLGPTALREVIADLRDNTPDPILADVACFIGRMARQLRVLTGE